MPKEDNTKSSPDENISEQNAGQDEIIRLMKNLHQAEIRVVKNDIEEVKNQIAAVEERLNVKLDQIDMALRGNTKDGATNGIGLFEQYRRMRTNLKIIALAVFVLYGAKIYGLTLENFVKNLFSGEQTSSHVEKEMESE